MPTSDRLGSRPVIGLARELRRLEAWLADLGAEARIFEISGIGGIGKTTLLLEMDRLARSSSVLTLWLDGQSELATSGAWLAGLEMSLESEYGRSRRPDQALLPYVAGELNRQRTVVFIDNCERLDRLESWLMSRFLPGLQHACVLLVFASRNGLPARWHADPDWGPRIEAFPLTLFTREEVLDYLRGSGLDESVQMMIAQRSDGHPLMLALTVDLLRSREEDAREKLAAMPAMLGADMLREVTSPALYRALAVMSLLPAADQSMLDRLLDAPLDVSAYHELGRLSFVHGGPHGMTLHHLVSRLLREDYARRNPEQFRTLRHKALKLLAERFRTAERRMQMRIAAHVLELYREFLPVSHAYVNFASALRSGEPQPYRPDDLPFLHRYLGESLAQSLWRSELVRAEDAHAVLDDIARYSPEGICVVRDDGGKPLAFCAGFRLDASTAPLLARYGLSLTGLFGEDGEQLGRVPPESADTVCVLLAAVDKRRPHYGPEELGALLMQQWLIEIAGGWRGMIVTAEPNMNELFSVLGFNRAGRVRLRGSEAEATRWELDFRQIAFEDWVHAVIRHTEQADTIGDERDEQPGASCSAPLDVNDAEQMLRHLFDAEALERLPAVRMLNRSGADVRRLVQSMLTAEPPPYPLTHSEQRLLRESYLRKDLSKTQLAAAFHMSRATFYRHSRLAMSHLAHALSNRLRPEIREPDRHFAP